MNARTCDRRGLAHLLRGCEVKAIRVRIQNDYWPSTRQNKVLAFHAKEQCAAESTGTNKTIYGEYTFSMDPGVQVIPVTHTGTAWRLAIPGIVTNHRALQTPAPGPAHLRLNLPYLASRVRQPSVQPLCAHATPGTFGACPRGQTRRSGSNGAQAWAWDDQIHSSWHSSLPRHS